MRLLVALLLLAGFALAGCTDSDKRSQDGSFGGFYGGVSGGGGVGH
jgi:hypothetical protein